MLADLFAEQLDANFTLSAPANLSCPFITGVPFNMPEIAFTVKHICKILLYLNTNKSSVLEGIPVIVLKNTVPNLFPF